MNKGISARVIELRAGRVPFVHAIVVRAQVPASARAGDDAIVLADGTIEGFVGGQCAETLVRTAALSALRDGESMLLRVLPDDAIGFPDSPGAQVVVNECLSGGALEIFLEPMLPAPLVQVVGNTPVADAVVAMADLLGYATGRLGSDPPGSVTDRSGSATDRSGSVTDRAGSVTDRSGSATSRSGADSPTGPATAVIVASHGRDENRAIRAALDAGVAYIALVASRRRGRSVLDELGLTEVERARISTPAGLDLGARTAPEVALSILAEVITAVRRPSPPGLVATAPPSPLAAVDPVCGMTVMVMPDTPYLDIDGADLVGIGVGGHNVSRVWFCNPGCRDTYAQLADVRVQAVQVPEH